MSNFADFAEVLEDPNGNRVAVVSVRVRGRCVNQELWWFSKGKLFSLRVQGRAN